MELSRSFSYNAESKRELQTLATREGSPRIDRLLPEQKLQLLSWYREHFEDIPGEERADYLQEFIQNGLVLDREARDLVEKMDESECARVGQFIASVMNVVEWRETFQECFDSLEISTQVEYIADLIEQPEALTVIAPFIRPGDKRLFLVFERGGDLSQESIDKYFYSSPSEVIPLFESLVTYFERHQDKVQRIDSGHDAVERKGFRTLLKDYPGYKDTLRSWVEQYGNKGTQLMLLPFVERLHALGELSDSERKILQTPQEETWADSAYSRMARDTVTELTSVEKGMHDVTDRKIDDSYIKGLSFEHMRPRERAIERFAVLDRGNKREIAEISKYFQSFREQITNIPDFLYSLCVSDYPVLLELEQLRVTKQEVALMFAEADRHYSSPFRTFDGSDVAALCTFNQAHEDGPDLEDVLLRHIEMLSQRDNYVQDTLTQLIFNLSTLWPQLSKKVQEGIITTVNSVDPSLWIFNPKFALEHVFADATDFIEKLAAYPERFFYEYQYLRHTIAHSGIDGGEKGDLLKRMEETFCSVLGEQPTLILSPKQSALCESVLPREKLVEILRGLINEFTPSGQLRDLIQSKYIDDVKDEVKDLAREEAVFVSLSSHGRPVLETLFGRTEYMELLQKYFSKVDVGNVLMTSSGVSEFSKKEIKDLISLASEEGSETQLCKLSKHLLRYESERTASPDRIKKEITNQQDLLNSIKLKLGLASTHAYKTVAVYEMQVAEKMKKIKGLQQQLLETATVSSFDAELDLAKEALIEACQKKPEIVFQKGVIDVLEERALPFMREAVGDYTAKHPEVLEYATYGDGFGKQIYEILGREVYGSLLEKHRRYLIFGRQETPGYCDFSYRDMPGKLRDVCASLDPFYSDGISYELDYYDTILGRVEAMAYYPLVSDTLARIAKEQQTTLGVQKERIAPPQEFAELILKIAALESSWLAKRVLPEVAKLQPKEQLRMMELLFIAARHNFDDELADETLSLEDVSTHIISRLRGGLADRLDVSETLLTDQFSPRTLQSFSEFYETALNNSRTGKEAFTSVLGALTKYPYEDWKLWGGDKPTNDAEAADRLDVLKQEKLIPEGMNLEAYQAWSTQTELSFDEMLTYEIGDVVQGVRQILHNALADGHITQEALGEGAARAEAELEMLMEPLKNITNQLQHYLEIVKRGKNPEQSAQYDEAEETYRLLKDKQQAYRSEHGSKIDTLTAQLYLDRLRNLTADELRSGAIRFMKKDVRFDRVFKLILETFKDEFPGITEDIFRIQQTVTEGKTQVFGEARVSRKRLTITDVIDFDTAFHIGQYPVPSCQSFASKMGYNEGLLSYVADPSTHIIQVWDEDKQLIARSIVRLMADKTQKPALFVERIYSVNAHRKITEAMMSFAQQKAERVGARLYTSPDNLVASKGTAALFNSGTRSSATYSDAGGGFVPGGVFKISAAREV